MLSGQSPGRRRNSWGQQGYPSPNSKFRRSPPTVNVLTYYYMKTPAPAQMTLAEADRALQIRAVSAVELAKACIERIEKYDAALNAVVHRNFDRALFEAKKIDSVPERTSPLQGVPYLAKDVYCEKGISTTACSNILRGKDYKPPFDSTTTIRLKRAGAISLGKTNTDEFTMGASTETSCYGVTKNPWDTSRVAGGSSGGSAAAVAAAEGLFGLGAGN